MKILVPKILKAILNSIDNIYRQTFRDSWFCISSQKVFIPHPMKKHSFVLHETTRASKKEQKRYFKKYDSILSKAQT